MEKQREVKVFKLDFSSCTTCFEIYEHIRKELELPEWFGANLDALWDSLTGIMYVPAQIIVCKNVGNKELAPLVERIVAVMHEAEETYHEIKVFEKD